MRGDIMTNRFFGENSAWVCIAAILPALLLILPSSAAAQASKSAGAGRSSVQRAGTPKRGPSRAAPARSKSSKRGRPGVKRADESTEASGGQAASEMEPGAESSRGQEGERGNKPGAGSDVAGPDGEQGVRKGSGRTAPVDGVKSQPDEASDMSAGQAGPQQAPRYSRRMEFDARLVYGETAGSGAVILFERGQRQLPPLTKQRTRFLSATIESVLGPEAGSGPKVAGARQEAEPDKAAPRSTSNGSRD